MHARIVTAALLALLGAGACGSDPEVITDAKSESAPPALGDSFVLLASDDSVYGVPVEGGVTNHWSGAVAAPGRSTVVTAQPTLTGTAVSAVAPGDGTVRWSDEVAGDFGVRVVSADGQLAALGPGAVTGTAYQVAGRARTDLVVVGDGNRRSFDLAGNFEPEAFTSNGNGLVLIEYLPAENPDSYTVRLLDLSSGDVRAVPDIDGAQRPAMRGTARTSVMSSDGTRLYTYYAAPEGALVHGEVYNAFLHVLDLDEMWAHCVGLDAPFGSATVALGLAAGDDRLFVADTGAGAIAEIDTERTALTRVARIEATEFVGGEMPSLAVGDDAVYLATGTAVSGFSRSDLTPTTVWQAPAAVLGLRYDGAGRELFASLPEQVAALDPDALDPDRWYVVPGAVDIRSADPAMRPVSRSRDEILCAC